MGQRAWFAWHALDRDEAGQPPARRELERRHGLTNGALYKLIWDKLKRPGYATVVKAAAALNCTPDWLQSEKGPGPRASLPIVPRPAHPPRPEKKSLAAVTAGYAVSEQAILRVAESGAEDIPGATGAEQPDQRKATTNRNKPR